MTVSPKSVCLIVAIALFALAAFFNFFLADGSRFGRFNLVAGGLFFFALRELLT